MNEEVLKKSTNPFSVILLTVILALKNPSQSKDNLLDLKLDLAKSLLRKGFEKEKVRALLNFLRFYIRLDEKSGFTFEEQLDLETGKTYPMGIEQLILELERKEGVKEGIQKGIEKGALETKTQVILTGFDSGLDLSLLANITGLNTSTVEDILRQHEKIK